MSYREITDAVIELIRTGEIEAGSLLPTERELQERFGASRSVVRRALSEIVDTGWGEAIPNKGVAALVGPATSRNRNIAFVDQCSAFNRHLFVSLNVQLQQVGRHLVLVDSENIGDEGALEYANEQGFAAAFVWSKTGYPDTSRIQPILRQMPVITLDHRLKGITCDLVTDDNHSGAWLATTHLAAQGRTRIAISGMFDMTEPTHERFGGYLQALFDAGFTPTPRDFLFSATSSSDGRTDTHLLELRLREDDRPDAVFVLQDEQVPAVARAISEAGLRVPDDIALVAFREDFIMTFGDVALTTVAVDWDQFARQCVTRLLERLERPNLPSRTFRLPTQLHVRGSCGGSSEASSPGTTTRISNSVHRRTTNQP